MNERITGYMVSYVPMKALEAMLKEAGISGRRYLITLTKKSSSSKDGWVLQYNDSRYVNRDRGLHKIRNDEGTPTGNSALAKV